MKKGLTILIAVLVLFGVILAGGGASADDVVVGRSVEITGVGEINADIDLQTESGYAGLSLSERISTLGSGFKEPSIMEYGSSFELGCYNDNDTVNVTSELEYESTAKIINAKRTVYTRNYNLGAVMGMAVKGDINHEIGMYMDDSLSTAEIIGDSVGRLKLFEKVKNPKDTHSSLSCDVIELNGSYNVIWNAYAEYYTYPADETLSNWLGCP